MIVNIPNVVTPLFVYSWNDTVASGEKLTLSQKSVLASGFFVNILKKEMIPVTLSSEEIAKAFNLIGKHVICVDKDAVSTGIFTEEEFQAILLHEEGHIVNKDVEAIHAGKKRNIKMEIEADKYALKKCKASDLKSALKKVIRLTIGRMKPELNQHKVLLDITSKACEYLSPSFAYRLYKIQ